MSAPRTNLIASIVYFASIVGLLETSLAQEAQNSNLQSYRELRQSLLAQGWKPDANHGLKLANGKPLYRFPEVLCGPKLCNAKWRDPKGAEKLISILRGYGEEEYRVLPQ